MAKTILKPRAKRKAAQAKDARRRGDKQWHKHGHQGGGRAMPFFV